MGEETHILVAAENGVGIAHMVAVVVCEKNTNYAFGPDAVGGQLRQHVIVVYAGVDKQTARWCTDIRAVTAASAAERHITQLLGHGKLLFGKRQQLSTVVYGGSVEESGLRVPILLLFAFLASACHALLIKEEDSRALGIIVLRGFPPAQRSCYNRLSRSRDVGGDTQQKIAG